MHTIMEGFRSKNLSYYVEEAEEAYTTLLKKHTRNGAIAILESATASYNRAWFTELFWQDFQQMLKTNPIPVELVVSGDLDVGNSEGAYDPPVDSL